MHALVRVPLVPDALQRGVRILQSADHAFEPCDRLTLRLACPAQLGSVLLQRLAVRPHRLRFLAALGALLLQGMHAIALGAQLELERVAHALRLGVLALQLGNVRLELSDARLEPVPLHVGSAQIAAQAVCFALLLRLALVVPGNEHLVLRMEALQGRVGHVQLAAEHAGVAAAGVGAERDAARVRGAVGVNGGIVITHAFGLAVDRGGGGGRPGAARRRRAVCGRAAGMRLRLEPAHHLEELGAVDRERRVLLGERAHLLHHILL